MAYVQTHSAEFQSSRPSFLSRARAAIARGFAYWIEANSRADRIAALEAKSDADLARMDLRREDIVRHVFRDRMVF
ncbi:hypothetical protein [Palleronia abyssalis]|uniref:DUF1127 domain-containing protein n=1 Tax=Palleronia abyssalis TaxID=1501240 RepID=A0A2R8BYZ8_9RHOB|nr:hypothetical protein [Palleronia abyssalis]SPJ25380.1 hypothetical protein PAA8504_03231 [Palleronia abyssalis]